MNTIFRLSMMVSALTLIPEPPLSAGKLVWPLKPGSHAYTRQVGLPALGLHRRHLRLRGDRRGNERRGGEHCRDRAGRANLFLVVCDMQPVSLD